MGKQHHETFQLLPSPGRSKARTRLELTITYACSSTKSRHARGASVRRRRSLDSTLLDDAVATQDIVTQLVSAIRRVRRLVPDAAAVVVAAHDYDASGKPVCAWDDPDAKAALISGLVNDASAVITAVNGVELTAEQTDAVGLLGLVAGQDVEPGDGDATWRIAQRVAPDRVISTVDPETCHMHKSVSEYRDGFKARRRRRTRDRDHHRLRLDPRQHRRRSDRDQTARRRTARAASPGRLGLRVGEVRVELRHRRHRAAIKALPMRHAIPGGFDCDDFIIDHHNRTATCPAGHCVPIAPRGSANFRGRCNGCALRQRCTTSRPDAS